MNDVKRVKWLKSMSQYQYFFHISNMVMSCISHYKEGFITSTEVANILCSSVANNLVYSYHPLTYFDISEGWKNNNRESLAEISLIFLPLPGDQLHSSQLSGLGATFWTAKHRPSVYMRRGRYGLLHI